jgi:predicted TIM-barrel fold metal-dependent hydrolase
MDPEAFPSFLITAMSRNLKHQMLVGSDYPLITPDRWLDDFAQLGLEPDVQSAILKENATRILGLG